MGIVGKSLAAAAALLCAGVNVAAAAQFGALAYSPSTGSYGYSHNYSTRGQAESVAEGGCLAYAGDCRIILYFYNACAALAIGNNYGYGYGWAGSRGTARSVAMANCRANDSGCRLVETVCSR